VFFCDCKLLCDNELWFFLFFYKKRLIKFAVVSRFLIVIIFLPSTPLSLRASAGYFFKKAGIEKFSVAGFQTSVNQEDTEGRGQERRSGFPPPRK